MHIIHKVPGQSRPWFGTVQQFIPIDLQLVFCILIVLKAVVKVHIFKWPCIHFPSDPYYKVATTVLNDIQGSKLLWLYKDSPIHSKTFTVAAHFTFILHSFYMS